MILHTQCDISGPLQITIKHINRERERKSISWIVIRYPHPHNIYLAKAIKKAIWGCEKLIYFLCVFAFILCRLARIGLVGHVIILIINCDCLVSAEIDTPRSGHRWTRDSFRNFIYVLCHANSSSRIGLL